MNVSGVSSAYATATVTKIDVLIEKVSGSSGGGKCGGAQAEVSKAGSLFGKLEDLQQADPAKLKDVLKQIADTLNSEAASATGSEKDKLSEIAKKFDAASQSGDLSQLKPHGGHDHGHHAKPAETDANASPQNTAQDPYAVAQQNAVVDFLNTPPAKPSSTVRDDVQAAIEKALSGVTSASSAS